MNEDIKELLKSLATAENAETIAKLTQAIGETEDALKAKDDEVRKTKETMIEYALRAVGTEKEGLDEEGYEDNEESVDEVLERWRRDPDGEFKKAKKKGL